MSDDVALLRKGRSAVEAWRKDNPTEVLVLSSSDLRGLDLSGYDLRGSVLYRADLRGAILTRADLGWVPLPDDDDAIPTNLVEANLEGVHAQHACFGSARMARANMHKANLYSADLTSCDLRDATLCKANLQAVDFGFAKLGNADLREAMLGGARFRRSDLQGADFGGCAMSSNRFIDCRLSGARGLDSVSHHFPLIIDVSTLMQLEEPIPREFLVKGGVLPSIIEAFERIVALHKEHTVFVSYTHQGEDISRWVEGLSLALQGKGVYVFLDQWDVHPGDSLTRYMDQGISSATHVLFVCTPASVARADAETHWTGYEARQLKSLGVKARIKTIAVLREGEEVPQYLEGTMWADFRDDLEFESSLETLVTAIRGSARRPVPSKGSV